jgi:hypothetical protein
MKSQNNLALQDSGLASGDCRAIRWMRWLCYPINQGDWTGDRFIPAKFACRISIGIDDLTFA